jgi:hypothetical protein
MTRRLLVTALLLLSGCTWSNSLYQARRLAGEAERAEREGRPFDAEGAWSQAAVKAESAFARRPTGRAAAEALWVRGRAAARRRDCAAAIAAFDASRVAEPETPWREAMLLESGRCRQELGDPAAMEQFAALFQSANPGRVREARLRAGRIAVQSRQYAEALSLLAGEDTIPARIDRAVALAALDRTDESLAEVEPLLSAGDSTAVWAPLVELLASQDTEDADRFLARLAAQPTATESRRAEWLAAAIRGAIEVDPAAAERRFADLVQLPPSRWVGEGRLMIAEHRISQAASMDGLRAAVAALGSLAEGGGLATIRITDLRRLGGRMVTEHDSLRAGLPPGDLALFALAEEARDSLEAPALARWLLLRLEQEWSASPFVPKAMMARMALAPDSAEQIRSRLATFEASPYLGFTRGERDPRFAALEDSLNQFLVARARRNAVSTVPVDNE